MRFFFVRIVLSTFDRDEREFTQIKGFSLLRQFDFLHANNGFDFNESGWRVGLRCPDYDNVAIYLSRPLEHLRRGIKLN